AELRAPRSADASVAAARRRRLRWFRTRRGFRLVVVPDEERDPRVRRVTRAVLVGFGVLSHHTPVLARVIDLPLGGGDVLAEEPGLDQDLDRCLRGATGDVADELEVPLGDPQVHRGTFGDVGPRLGFGADDTSGRLGAIYLDDLANLEPRGLQLDPGGGLVQSDNIRHLHLAGT